MLASSHAFNFPPARHDRSVCAISAAVLPARSACAATRGMGRGDNFPYAASFLPFGVYPEHCPHLSSLTRHTYARAHTYVCVHTLTCSLSHALSLSLASSPSLSLSRSLSLSLSRSLPLSLYLSLMITMIIILANKAWNSDIAACATPTGWLGAEGVCACVCVRVRVCVMLCVCMREGVYMPVCGCLSLFFCVCLSGWLAGCLAVCAYLPVLVSCMLQRGISATHRTHS